MLRTCTTNDVSITLDISLFSFLVPFKQNHNKFIENMEKQGNAKIVGGNMFPLEKAYIWFLCHGKSLIEDFVKAVHK